MMSIISSQSADNFWFCEHFDEGKVCETSRLAISEKWYCIWSSESINWRDVFFQLNRKLTVISLLEQRHGEWKSQCSARLKCVVSLMVPLGCGTPSEILSSSMASSWVGAILSGCWCTGGDGGQARKGWLIQVE